MTFTLGLAAGPAKALTIYTAGPGGLIKQLAAGFQEKTGIKVDVFQATTGKGHGATRSRGRQPRADVLISASWDTAQDLDQRGWLLPYESPNPRRVPARWARRPMSPRASRRWALSGTPRAARREPRDWADLTGPGFKQAVTMPDPALSGASLDLLLGLQNARARRRGSCSRRCATTA